MQKLTSRILIAAALQFFCFSAFAYDFVGGDYKVEAEKQYSAGEVIPAAGQIPKIAVNAQKGRAGAMVQLQLFTNNPVITNGVFRIHFFSKKPKEYTINIPDLDAASGYIGTVDVVLYKKTGVADIYMGIGMPTFGNYLYVQPEAGANTIYYFIESRAAYHTAANQWFRIQATFLDKDDFYLLQNKKEK